MRMWWLSGAHLSANIKKQLRKHKKKEEKTQKITYSKNILFLE